MNLNRCNCRFRARHKSFARTGVTLLLGLAVSSVACDVLRSGFNGLSGKSEGTLVANTGMTLAEVRARSTLKLEPSVHYPTGEEMTAANARFDFEIAGTSIRFEGCRYYWLMADEKGHRGLSTISVGTSPRHMSIEELGKAFNHVEQQLKEDGWLQGHHQKEPPPRFVSPKKLPWGNLLIWTKGDTLLLLRDKRMDDEKPGEDERSGEFIQYVELHPRNDELYKDWEFSD